MFERLAADPGQLVFGLWAFTTLALLSVGLVVLEAVARWRRWE